MKISIITVVYNAVSLIEQTLQSVVEQDHEPVEYIVVDGKSDDGTLSVIERFRDRIDVLISEKDDGMYEAMNKGIAVASGEFALFMNAGDTFYSRGSISSLAKQISDGCDVIYGDRNYIHGNGRAEIQASRHINTLFQRMPYCHQSALASTKVLREFPFNTTYRFAADYNQLVEMYLAGKRFQQVPGPICNYIEGGISESGLRPYLEVLKIQFDNCNDRTILRKSAYLQGFKKNINQLLDI